MQAVGRAWRAVAHAPTHFLQPLENRPSPCPLSTVSPSPRSHFVPNLTLGAPIVSSLRKHTSAFLDCHLMVTAPGAWVADFAKAGASQVTFHVEAVGACAGDAGGR